MEEVWNDITLSSLNPNPNSHFQTLTFQDFLSQPFSSRNPNQPFSGGSAVAYPSPASPPPIALALNSVRHSDDRFIHNNPFGNVPPHHNHCLSNVSFDELASPEIGRKRVLENENSGDRRHKRMIKNRESAARSRARRQAYTNELELEVTHLTEENARLKRQQQQLCLAAASQVPKRHTLHRASTAPF